MKIPTATLDYMAYEAECRTNNNLPLRRQDWKKLQRTKEKTDESTD